ncbi:hypothetical protein ACFLR4_04495 [Bacteroidota bacterium]
MTENKPNIARRLVFLILIFNFLFSPIALGVNGEHNSCSMEDEKCNSCCSDNLSEKENDSHLVKMQKCDYSDETMKNEASICNCYHGPGIDTNFIFNSIKVEKDHNTFIQSTFLLNTFTELGHPVDYSILDVRINPPPIYLSVSSFLI